MTIKRSFVAILLGLSTVAAVAQSGYETQQTNNEGKGAFAPHWYMQLQAGASHTVGEASFGDLVSPAAAVNFGYRFSPLLGLRFGASGWEAKGAWASPKTVYKYNYVQGNVDLTLDISSLLCRYNPQRVFNAYMFAGVGVNGAFNNDEAGDLVKAGYNLQYYWDNNKVNVVGRAGVGANIKLSKKVYFNVEVNGNVLSDKYNSKKAGNADWQFNALAGFTIKLGKSHKKPAPVYQEPAPAPAPAPAPVVKEEPAPAPAPVVAKVEPLQKNIFFLINSSKIRAKEQVKVEELVRYLNEHPDAKVTITGFADKQTGNAAINRRISEKRANSVAQALKDQGIAESRITVDFKGDTVQPFNTKEENRVSICIAE